MKKVIFSILALISLTLSGCETTEGINYGMSQSLDWDNIKNTAGGWGDKISSAISGNPQPDFQEAADAVYKVGQALNELDRGSNLAHRTILACNGIIDLEYFQTMMTSQPEMVETCWAGLLNYPNALKKTQMWPEYKATFENFQQLRYTAWYKIVPSSKQAKQMALAETNANSIGELQVKLQQLEKKEGDLSGKLTQAYLKKESGDKSANAEIIAVNNELSQNLAKQKKVKKAMKKLYGY